MEKHIGKYFIRFWFSQLFSQLGSAVTSYVLILWIYSKTGSAFNISILSFCSFVPYILGSFIAGTFIDRYSKKKIIFFVDTLAFICTVITFFLLLFNRLNVLHIALINALIGFANSFQIPAVSVATERLTPEEYYTRASGMLSFSDALVVSFSAAIATVLYKSIGLHYVLLLDMITYFIANAVLLVTIEIPEQEAAGEEKTENFSTFIQETKEGFSFILQNKGLLMMILSMCVINFFSRITYENILPAMILSRSGSESVLSIVNIFIGAGGIVGGLIVSTKELKGNRISIMYFSIGFSFLFGDLTMAFGRNVFFWSIGALAASLPISFMMAAQRTIIFTQVPKDKQGRIFSAKNAIQYCLIPVGILLGGYLADNVFEPFLLEGRSAFAKFLFRLFGGTPGSGMALMFALTGVLGTSMCVYMLCSKDVREIGTTKQSPENYISEHI